MFLTEPTATPTSSTAAASAEASTPPWEKDTSYLTAQPPSIADSKQTLSEEDVEKALVLSMAQGDGGGVMSPFVSFAVGAQSLAWTMSRLTKMSWKGNIDFAELQSEVYVEFDQLPGTNDQFTGRFWTRPPGQTAWQKYWLNSGVLGSNGTDVSWKCSSPTQLMTVTGACLTNTMVVTMTYPATGYNVDFSLNISATRT